MERTLELLFDYQLFENETSLNELIEQTELRTSAQELTADELSQISAAGMRITNDLFSGNKNGS